MDTYEDIELFEGGIDNALIKFDAYTQSGKLESRLEGILELLNLSRRELSFKKHFSNKIDAWIELLGVSIEITNDYLEIQFHATFFNKVGKTLQECWNQHKVIRRLVEFQTGVVGIYRNIHINIDVKNLDVFSYYENDYSQQKTIMGGKGYSKPLLDNNGDFKGTIYFKSNSSSYEICLYQKDIEISDYVKNLKNGGKGAYSKIDYYISKGYFDIEKLGRFEIRLMRRWIKTNFEKEIYLEDNIQTLIKKALSHFYKNHRFYYNHLGKLKDWQMRERSKLLAEHPLWKKLFLNNEEYKAIDYVTPSDCIYSDHRDRYDDDFFEAMINLILKYGRKDWMTKERLEHLFLKSILRYDEYEAQILNREKRRADTLLYLSELSPKLTDEEISKLKNNK